MMLLGIGLAGLLGNALVGSLIAGGLRRVLTLVPLAMAGLALALVAAGGSAWIVAVLLVGWGLVSTPVPVAWGTWLTRALPDEMEAGGGLMVATIQFAITLDASVGGVAFDARGYQLTFALSAGLLLAGACLASKAVASSPRKTTVTIVPVATTSLLGELAEPPH